MVKLPFSNNRNNVWPVVFTPFKPSGKIDFTALEAMLEYYIEQSVEGVFVVCLAGEMFDLTQQQRIEIARFTANTVNNRVLVAVGANFGDTLSCQAKSMDLFANTGADILVIGTSLLPLEADIGEEILNLAKECKLPCGIYELPLPEHVTLSVEDIKKIAHSGKFVFMKDTCREIDTFIKKCGTVEGTNLRIYQANLRCLVEQPSNVGYGFCGCMANICPGLIKKYLTTKGNKDSKKIEKVLLNTERVILNYGFPASGKQLLQELGLPILNHCLNGSSCKSQTDDTTIIQTLINELESTIKELKSGYSYLDCEVV